jgi:hypothetical protein
MCEISEESNLVCVSVVSYANVWRKCIVFIKSTEAVNYSMEIDSQILNVSFIICTRNVCRKCRQMLNFLMILGL